MQVVCAPSVHRRGAPGSSVTFSTFVTFACTNETGVTGAAECVTDARTAAANKMPPMRPLIIPFSFPWGPLVHFLCLPRSRAAGPLTTTSSRSLRRRPCDSLGSRRAAMRRGSGRAPPAPKTDIGATGPPPRADVHLDPRTAACYGGRATPTGGEHGTLSRSARPALLSSAALNAERATRPRPT